MAWVCCDKDGQELISTLRLERYLECWLLSTNAVLNHRDECDVIELPKGSIKKLIGRDMSWKDEPVELK